MPSIIGASAEACAANCKTFDIGPAQVCITDPCDATFEDVIIECGDQLEGLGITMSRSYTERRSQCSSMPVAYILSGFDVTATISLGEGQFRRELIEMLHYGTFEVDALDTTRMNIFVGDEAGLCPRHYEVVIKPLDGDTVAEEGQWLILPWAIVRTESIDFSFETETQRGVTLEFFGEPHPDNKARLIIQQENTL